ncbi:hypothetical protein ACFWUZ_12380 [Streptomyces sp. NPDC058646]|uniref:hypothetical protein n=1 Tax=Streptomyces sp. NPDC058646 TaxID=3346574 RepID=UPI003651A3F0
MSLPSEPGDEVGDEGDAPPSRAVPSRAGRAGARVLSALLLTLTCLLVPVSLITVWVHDIVLDTDRYVSTVAPLASDPAIEAAAVHRIAEAADVRVDGARVTSDLAAWLEEQGLPPRVGTAVKALGPRLDAAADQAVTEVATRFVGSDRFETVWRQANRAAHTAVVHALTGRGRGAVGIEGGTVTLDVGTAVERVTQELADAGLSPAEKIPAVDRQMVLFRSDELGKIRGAVGLLDKAGTWLPVLTVLLGTAGVLLARGRRRALAATAICAAAACLLFAAGLALARRHYLDHLPEQVQSPEAAAAVFDTLVRFLRAALRTAAVLGVVVALGAYLSGPGRLPRGLRRRADGAAESAARRGAGHGLSTGAVGAWTEAHRRPLTAGAVLVPALVFALWNHPTVATVLLLLLILLAVLAVLALVAATGRVRDPGGGKG